MAMSIFGDNGIPGLPDCGIWSSRDTLLCSRAEFVTYYGDKEGALWWAWDAPAVPRPGGRVAGVSRMWKHPGKPESPAFVARREVDKYHRFVSKYTSLGKHQIVSG